MGIEEGTEARRHEGTQVRRPQVCRPQARRYLTLEEVERRYVQRLLAVHGGNVTRTAAALGISRRQLQIRRRAWRARDTRRGDQARCN